MTFWLGLAFLAFALAVTLATRWLAARLWPGGGQPPDRPSIIAADLLWTLILLAGGLLARRYIERITTTALGYLLFALGALGLSLLRAFLYQRTLCPPRPQELPHVFLDLRTLEQRSAPPGERIRRWWFRMRRLIRSRWHVFATAIAAAIAGHRLLAAAAAAVVLLALAVAVSRPAPPPPSFAQGLAQYLSLRGRTLAFADVEGTWQATGRRISARFEILNARGQSLILLDHYSGSIFTAGQGAADDLYLNRLTVQQGAAVNIKPVQIRLQAQPLAEALPILYQMQTEPGLQHIFISGDLVLPAGADPDPRLRPDHRQMEVRRIVAQGDGHYSLHYLTAAEMIALAGVPVETADLLIVATYTSPADGPTATPLPSPIPAGGEP